MDYGAQAHLKLLHKSASVKWLEHAHTHVGILRPYSLNRGTLFTTAPGVLLMSVALKQYWHIGTYLNGHGTSYHVTRRPEHRHLHKP